MSEYELGDASSKAFEARLAAAAPQLAPAEQQELLYRCAYEAGQRAGRGRVRRWQAATAAAVTLLAAGLLLPVKPGTTPVHEGAAAQFTRHDPPSPTPVVESRAPTRQLTAVELDAWQLERPATAPLSEELALFERLDQRMQSSSVAHLLRGLAQW